MKNTFKSFYIEKKIRFLFVLLSFFVLCFFTVGMIYILKSIITENLTLMQENNIQLVKNQLNEFVISMENCANTTVIGLNEYSDVLMKEKRLRTEEQKIQNILYKTNSVFRQIDSIVFIDVFGTVYSTVVPYEDAFLEKMQVYAKESIGQVGGNSEVGVVRSQHNGCLLTIAKKISDINSGETLGYLSVNMKEDRFASLYEKLMPAIQNTYYITDWDGMVYSALDKDLIGTKLTRFDPASPEYSQSKNRGLFTKNNYKMNSFSFAIISFVSFMEIMKGFWGLIVFAGGIWIFCIFISFYFSKKVAAIITRPIMELTQTMSLVTAGDLSVQMKVDTLDETKILSEGFNKMLESIHQLLRDVEKKEKEKRKAELRLMQDQIRPHFLYNTLDIIYVLLHMERHCEAKKATKALADFYRSGLSKGREIITMKEELAITKNYLIILYFRYSDRFTYDIQAPETCDAFFIPKLTIQPIVENAIYHGIKEKGEGHLTISVTETETHIQITIHDDGVGMGEEKLQDILREDGNKVGFGLKNVHQRLQAYFGSSSGLNIASIPDEGTTVTIVFPKEEVMRDV